MPRNFVEEGAASSVLAIADYADIPLAETQKELTPLQRMVITLEAQRQHEEAQEAGPQSAGGGHTNAGTNQQIMNSRAQPGGGTISGNTTTYINEGAQ